MHRSRRTSSPSVLVCYQPEADTCSARNFSGAVLRRRSRELQLRHHRRWNSLSDFISYV